MKVAIVGSGLAGCTTAEELRKHDPSAEIWLLSQEANGLYSRPLLSHGFSRQDVGSRIVMKNLPTLEAALSLKTRAPVTVTGLNPSQMALTLSSGEVLSGFDKIVLATGSEAFVPPHLLPFRNNFVLLNSLDDLHSLLKVRQTVNQPKWIIIGGGLIGCEVGADLAQAGDRVVIVHLMDRLMERQLTSSQSQRLLDHLTAAGVEVKLQKNVVQIESPSPNQVIVTMQDGTHAQGNFALVAVGFRPRADLAREAGLKVNKGIVTDGFLQTSHPNIFAVGDVAEIAGAAPYAFVAPVRNQALWLGKHLHTPQSEPWKAPPFRIIAKVHGFKAE